MALGEVTKKQLRPIRSFAELYHMGSIPFVAIFGLNKRYIHSDYKVTLWGRFRLVTRLWRNTRHIATGTSYKAQAAIAAKLLSIPKSTQGVVVECGCWVGGSTANLSLICKLVDRQLIVYDSYEGLPAAEKGDRHAKAEAAGMFCGALETVQANVRKYGDISRCEFRKGWFSATLPHHSEKIALICADVDWQASLHDVVVNLWPHLNPQGYFFIDEYMYLDYCGLFWSESFWKKYFDCGPPGLMGSGVGVGVGQYYSGPFDWKVDPTSIAYTRKDFSGHWNYDPQT